MEKLILDACCGGRWFWFNKQHDNAIYIDSRIAEKGHDKYRKNHCVIPDVVMDFRDLKYADGTFSLVVFDPPHMATLGDSSKFKRYYGRLDRNTWREDLKKGFSECYRVLKESGVLVFKWNESEIKLKEIIPLFPCEPLFGHPTNSKNTTHWVCFMKLKAAHCITAYNNRLPVRAVPSPHPNGEQNIKLDLFATSAS
jgi:SAM-dependent methyltransferase